MARAASRIRSATPASSDSRGTGNEGHAPHAQHHRRICGLWLRGGGGAAVSDRRALEAATSHLLAARRKYGARWLEPNLIRAFERGFTYARCGVEGHAATSAKEPRRSSPGARRTTLDSRVGERAGIKPGHRADFRASTPGSSLAASGWAARAGRAGTLPARPMAAPESARHTFAGEPERPRFFARLRAALWR